MHTSVPFYIWDQSVLSDVRETLESVICTCHDIGNHLEDMIHTSRAIVDYYSRKSSPDMSNLDDAAVEDIPYVLSSMSLVADKLSRSITIACATKVVHCDNKDVSTGNLVSDSENMILVESMGTMEMQLAVRDANVVALHTDELTTEDCNTILD